MRAGICSARHSAMPTWAKSRHTPAPLDNVSSESVAASLTPYL
jgi:hypothetical protein